MVKYCATNMMQCNGFIILGNKFGDVIIRTVSSLVMGGEMEQ